MTEYIDEFTTECIECGYSWKIDTERESCDDDYCSMVHAHPDLCSTTCVDEHDDKHRRGDL